MGLCTSTQELYLYRYGSQVVIDYAYFYIVNIEPGLLSICPAPKMIRLSSMYLSVT